MADWLLSQQVSLAFTSYGTGRLILAGVAPDGRLSFDEQDYTRAMGLDYRGGELHVASLYQVWRLTNMLAPGEYANRAHDAVFVPRSSQVTGYVDAHEIARDGEGRLIFVNSRYSCLAVLDPDSSFRPIWKPPFISSLAPEDRCHLNGLAMVDGRPRYVTAFSETDAAAGWRNRPTEGGVLIDLESGEIVTRNLSMPHSPRVHDGELWALDSGTGYLVRIDVASGHIERHVFCPGFLRGLAFRNGHAIVTVSRPRPDSAPAPFASELERQNEEAWCGLLVIDLARGEIAEFIRYESGIDELFDVALLPGIRNPISLGPSTEELLTTIRFAALPPAP